MIKIKLPKIIVIVGPTASGKSALALRLAKLAQGKAFKKAGILGAEIISADSRQVYRNMDIGTGKVTKKEQKIVKHHLIDVTSPKKQFTVNDFKRLGDRAIEEILTKEKTPIIVGGTGFYIDILLGRMQVAQVSPNKKLRAKLEKQSAEQLFKRLQKIDLNYSKIIDRHNKRRLIRALEIVLSTGSPIPKPIISNKYQVLWLGINPKNLEKRIAKRLDHRFAHGMISEVKNLIKNGSGHKRLQSFGLEYKWISLYLQNKISYLEMHENLLRDIIRYSKRQMTWFKRNREIRWLKDTKTTERLARCFLN